MGRGFNHAPITARGTDSAVLAREGDEAVVSAGIAADAQEAMGQHAAGATAAHETLVSRSFKPIVYDRPREYAE